MPYSARTLVNAVAYPAAVVDVDGRVLTANMRWIEAAAAGGLHAHEFDAFPGRDGDHVERATLTAALRTIGPDDPAALVGCGEHLVRIAPLESDSGAYRRLVTTEPRSNRGSTDPDVESQAIVRAKSQFLALLGHELRTPVSAVVGMVDLLRAIPLAQEVREVVDGVHRSTHALKSMLDDLLDLARLETGQLDLDERPLSPRRLLEDVIEPLQQQVRQKGLLLLAGVAPDMPGTIVADGSRLRQVLTSLVGNAVKFTERGEVVLAGSREDTTLVISVSDTGPGLTHDDRDRIFAPFVQVDSSSARRHEGAGLGLAIAARLVARMGGTIEVDSQVGRGSEFQVRLPLVLSGPPEVERPTRLAARRVAVVAPSRRSGEVLGWMLAAAGANAIQADLASLIKDPPDVDAVLWCDDSHDPAAGERADAVVAAIGPSRRAIMISTTDPRRGSVRGPILITSPLTLRRLVAAINRERTGVRGAPIVVPRLPGGRILLAEDNDVNRGVFKRMITLLGVECDAVSDGEAAWRAVIDGPPYDLVLMDVQMPGMDGLTATRRIRADGSTTPILALTATALRGDHARCLEAGMNGHVGKPITLPELRQVLAPYLEPEAAPPKPPAPPAEVPPADTPHADTPTAAAPPSQPPGSPDVNLSRLHDLEDQLADRPLVVMTVTTYLAELDNRRAALSDALARDDRAALGATAHTLKSSSALLGADRLAQVCLELEQRAQVAAGSELAALLADVERAVTGTARAMTEYVEDPGS